MCSVEFLNFLSELKNLNNELREVRSHNTRKIFREIRANCDTPNEMIEIIKHSFEVQVPVHYCILLLICTNNSKSLFGQYRLDLINYIERSVEPGTDLTKLLYGLI